MRFNQKRTCLDFLTGKIPDDIHIPKKTWDKGRKMQLIQDIRASFADKENIQHFSSNVQYMTKPFYEAYYQTSEKVREIIVNEPLGKVKGTMILPLGDGITKTIFYGIDQQRLNSFSLGMLSFTTGHGITALDYMIKYIPVDIESMTIQHCISDAYYDVHKVGHSDITIDFLLMQTFIKHCDIKEKILKPKEKLREFGVHYFNEEKYNIQVLDSRWYTDLVKTDGFDVRRHIRAQPYGPGLTKKKFIFIQDFKKSGYTYKAKKTTDGNSNNGAD